MNDILDLRNLADEWEAWADDEDEMTASPEVGAAFVGLCEDLGIEATPDALRAQGDGDAPKLIRESYFAEYAQDYARELGLITDAPRWPLTCIDWDAAADELREDYMEVRYSGETYLVRQW